MKTIIRLTAVLLVAYLSSGCYLNKEIGASSAAITTDGGALRECIGAGVYSDASWFHNIDTYSGNTLTQEVNDKEVVTVDKQPVGVTASLQYRRKTDCDSTKNLLTKWVQLAKSDDELRKTIDSIVSQGIKVAVSQFSLNQLLEDRQALATTIAKDLIVYTDRFSVEVVSVGVKDVQVDSTYLDTLKQKAQYTVAVEAAQKKQDLIKQQAQNDQLQAEQNVLVAKKQLEVEKANTAVQLEIAQRAGRITAATYDVYKDNPAALELERLNRLKSVLGDKSTIYFITPGTNISLLLGQFAGTVIPGQNKQ